jgi:hypothetical protein
MASELERKKAYLNTWLTVDDSFRTITPKYGVAVTANLTRL